MRALHITAAGALFAMALTMAQAVDARGPRGGSGRTHHPEGGGIGEVLQLTEDQKAQLQSLRQQHHARVQQLREGGEVDREAVQALRQEHRDEFLSVLSDEQKDGLERFRAERLANRPEGDGERPDKMRRGPRRGAHREGERARLDQALGLSEDQKTQVQALRTEMRDQMKALRESGEGSREEAQALFQQHREQLQALLTDEQRAQLEELRANRPERRHPHGPPPVEDDGTTQSESAITAPTAVESTTWGKIKSGARD